MTSAPEILKKAAQHMEDRAAARDQQGGERSMLRTVTAFNALTGHQVSERDGWLFMAVLKAARATTTPTGIPDDYEDGAAYFGLAGEAAAGVRADTFDERAPSIRPYPSGAAAMSVTWRTHGKYLIVPPGYNWIAQDLCGAWFAFKEEPAQTQSGWSPSPFRHGDYSFLICGAENPNWRETLRKVRQ